MALDYDRLMSLPPREIRQTLTARDTILYALGVGADEELRDDPSWLRFLYEDGLEALPTQAAVMAYPGFWLKEPQYGLDWRRILHGEQSIEWFSGLPAEGVVTGVVTIDDIVDKGPETGALLYASRKIYDEDGRHLATVRQTSVLRGDGGFGGGSAAPPPRRTSRPERGPDRVFEQRTTASQALLYRLSGDLNPLHADPAVARAAGFDRPILHGLATYGFVGRGLLRNTCAGQPSRMKRLDARFSRPVFPGETLQTELWEVGSGVAVFQTLAVERGVQVLRDGYVEFAP